MGRARLRIILWILPLLGGVYLFYSSRTVELYIDGASKEFQVIFFGDQDLGGDSRIVSIQDSTHCCMTYRIGDTVPFPFVGCGYAVHDTTSLLDLQKYKSLKLLFDSTLCDTFTLALNFFTSGKSSLDDVTSQEPLVREIVPVGTSLELPLCDIFQSADWTWLFGPKRDVMNGKALASITFESSERFLRGDAHAIGVRGVVLIGDKEKAVAKAVRYLLLSFIPLLIAMGIRYRRPLVKIVVRLISGFQKFIALRS